MTFGAVQEMTTKPRSTVNFSSYFPDTCDPTKLPFAVMVSVNGVPSMRPDSENSMTKVPSGLIGTGSLASVVPGAFNEMRSGG